MSRSSDAARFTEVYRALYADLLRFVRRRLGDPVAAEDVVAEAMATAWRRIDDLPTEADQARAWLFGVARNCLLNQRRGDGRRDALDVRLAGFAGSLGELAPDDAGAVVARIDLARSWAQLDSADQEVIALCVLDGLDSLSAATVLGVSENAYRLRLSRARTRLRRLLEGAANRADAGQYQEVKP